MTIIQLHHTLTPPSRSRGSTKGLGNYTNPTTNPQSVASWLSRPVGFVKEEPMPRAYSPPPSLELLVILEEFIEVHGDHPAKREPKPFCLLWKEGSSPSRSAAYGPAESVNGKREWRES